MNLEKWEIIKSNVLDNFEVIDKYEEEDSENHVKKEIIEFNGPVGKIKLVFSIKDLILDKHTNYSNRIGSSISVDYVYSDTEKTYSLKAFKFANGDWEEIDASSF